MMRRFDYLCFTFLLLQFHPLIAQPLGGSDGLGRTLIQNAEAGDPIPDKKVGMFYFLWHGDGTSPHHWDLHKIVPNNPEVLNDFNNPAWGKGGMYYWGEPIYGYYRADDYWIHLRSMQLLTDAGVDFVVIDATNRLTYADRADVLMRAMDAIRDQGRKPPKIVFYTNTASGETMQEIYDKMYKEGAPYRHLECWFYLEGKPLIIGHSEEAKGTDYEEFFTVRESQWPNEPRKENGWPWIDFKRPQEVHYNTEGRAEIINVSVAQHPNPTAGMGGSAFYGNNDNWGRSYSNGNPGNSVEDIAQGLNFQEQWEHALKQDVPFIFVTGWNEWIAGKFESHDENPEHSWFCDQASPEYSRDIEPSRTGGIKDHYYMQLVNNIRRYKGIAVNPLLGDMKQVIDLEGWKDVWPEFKDYVGEVEPRNHVGAQSSPFTNYTNFTGRNDFNAAKVAHDKEHIYFYINTVDPITENRGKNWMNLYLNVDRKSNTGWEGFDFRVISGNILERYKNDYWQQYQLIDYKVSGSEMMMTIPKSAIIPGRKVDLEFKWSDNMQDETDPLDWYVNGDVAPGGRFTFIAEE